MRNQAVLAIVAALRGNVAELPARIGFDAHFCTDGCTVGNHAFQFDFQPLVAIAVIAVKQVGRLWGSGRVFAGSDGQIEEAIVVVIAKSEAERTRCAERFGGGPREIAFPVVQVQEIDNRAVAIPVRYG